MVVKKSFTALKYRARMVCDRHFSALVQLTLPTILCVGGLETMCGHGMCRFFTLPNPVVAIACPDFYICCILSSFLKFWWGGDILKLFFFFNILAGIWKS